MFGINGGELIILLVVIALVVGPERLPTYAEQLGKWVRGMRRYVQDARRRVDDELGDVGLDWEALDPRRYDPRRIVREALLDDQPATKGTSPSPGRVTAASTARAATRTAVPAPGRERSTGSASTAAPYDDEAT